MQVCNVKILNNIRKLTWIGNFKNKDKGVTLKCHIKIK